MWLRKATKDLKSVTVPCLLRSVARCVSSHISSDAPFSHLRELRADCVSESESHFALDKRSVNATMFGAHCASASSCLLACLLVFVSAVSSRFALVFCLVFTILD